MEYTRENLERSCQEALKATEQELDMWENSKYYLAENVVRNFWEPVKNAVGVAIVGDYDVDGITSTYNMLKAVKYVNPSAKVYCRIPRRFSEGYGINSVIADEIKEKLPKGSVVITVDNGISASEVLEDLEASGYTVLLTDHHELKAGAKIPAVTMVIDPVVPGADEGFNFKYWCGAGIAYKLAEQVVPEELAKSLEVFAAVATVADNVELREGNWGLVKRGIKTFREGKAPEALAMIAMGTKQDPNFVDEDTIGFYIGPCINAAGRLEDRGAAEVLKYFIKPDDEKLENLVELNKTRRALRDEEYDLVVKEIERTGQEDACPIWVCIPGLHEGIVGILAGKVSEDYGVPAVVLTNAREDGIVKGSARSVEGVDIFKYLSDINLFEKMGGHPGAAGLSMKIENVPRAASYQMQKPQANEEKEEKIFHLLPEEIPEAYEILLKYKPFGQDNPAPKFSLDFNSSKELPLMRGDSNQHLISQSSDGTYKITHFNHEPNELKNSKVFGMEGRISGTAYNGVETPTFNADEVYDIVDKYGSSTKSGQLNVKTLAEERESERSDELSF